MVAIQKRYLPGTSTRNRARITSFPQQNNGSPALGLSFLTYLLFPIKGDHAFIFLLHSRR
jgi:hypothetical protein